MLLHETPSHTASHRDDIAYNSITLNAILLLLKCPTNSTEGEQWAVRKYIIITLLFEWSFNILPNKINQPPSFLIEKLYEGHVLLCFFVNKNKDVYHMNIFLITWKSSSSHWFQFFLSSPQLLNMILLSGASLLNAHRPAVTDYLITRCLT